MIDTLNLGEYIYSRLQSDVELCSLLGATVIPNDNSEEESITKVFPVIADNNVKLPFIVYKRLSLHSVSNKDGYYQDEVTMEIIIVTQDYLSGVTIANKVREILEVTSITFNDMQISDANLNLATEEYTENSFVQKMQFNFVIN